VEPSFSRLQGETSALALICWFEKQRNDKEKKLGTKFAAYVRQTRKRFLLLVSQHEMGKISQLSGTIKRKPNSSWNLSVVRCTSPSFFTVRSVVRNDKGTSLCCEKLQNVFGNT